MKKIILIEEQVLHTHAVEVEVENEKELERIINELRGEEFEDVDDALSLLAEMEDLTVIGIEKDNDFRIDDIDYDTKDVD